MDEDCKIDMTDDKAALRRKCPFCGCSVPIMDSKCYSCQAALTGLDHIQFIDGFVSWMLLRGQIAVGYEGEELDAFAEARGVVIPNGIKALFYDNAGHYLGVLCSGTHLFDDEGFNRTTDTIPGSVFFNKIAGISNGSPVFDDCFSCGRDAMPLVEMPSEIFAVLVYELVFPTVLSLLDNEKDVAKSGLQARAKSEIEDVPVFYYSHLKKYRFASFDRFSNCLNSVVDSVVKNLMIEKHYDNKSDNLFSFFYSNMGTVAARATIKSLPITILGFDCLGEASEAARARKEELCVPDSELKENQAKIDFFNCIQRNNVSRKINEAESIADLYALIDEIDCREDNWVDYLSLLKAEKIVRKATTAENIDSAIDWCIDKGIIRHDEIELIKKEIELRTAMFNQADPRGILLKLDWDSEWNQILRRYHKYFIPFDPINIPIDETPIDYEKRDERLKKLLENHEFIDSQLKKTADDLLKINEIMKNEMMKNSVINRSQKEKTDN